MNRKMRSHIFGDSHAEYSFAGMPDSANHARGSMTMHRVGRDGLDAVNFKTNGVNDGNIVFLIFGEVDCRCHIHRQVNLGRKYEDILEELVENYFRTIRKNAVLYSELNIVIVSVVPPVTMVDYHNSNPPLDSEHPFPFIGSDARRVEITRDMNARLKTKAESFNYYFLDINGYYSRPDGTLKFELSDGRCHIKDNAYVIARAQELIDSCKQKKERQIITNLPSMISICLDVGSHNGTDALRIQDRYKTKVYAFEPHPKFFGITVMNTRFNPEIEVFPFAVSDSEEKFITLNESRGDQSHSILPFMSEEELLKSWGDTYMVRPSGNSYQVPLTRLDNFLISKGHTPETLSILDLHVDAQGVDLEVLRSLGLFLKCVQTGKVEAARSRNHCSYKGQNTIETVIGYLFDNGFIITGIVPNFDSPATAREFDISFARP